MTKTRGFYRISECSVWSAALLIMFKSLLVHMTPGVGADASCWLTPHLQHPASTALRWPQGERCSSSHWFISRKHKGACTQSHTHAHITHRVARARTHACVPIKHTHAKSIIWQVSNPALVCLPPSPLPSSFFIFLFQHSFSTRTPVPLSINYLYCLRSDLRSPVRICMDGARQACLILCHREFSIFI